MVRSLDDWQSRGDYGGSQARMVTTAASIGGTRTGPPLRLVVPDHAGARTGERETAGGQPQARPASDGFNGTERPAHHDTRKRRWYWFAHRGRPQTVNVADYDERIAAQLDRLNRAREQLGQDRLMLSDLMD